MQEEIHTKREGQYLSRTYKISQIIALVATPVAVAFIGFTAQRSVADANANAQNLAASIAASTQLSVTKSGIQRDLLQTAVHVLRTPRQADDLEIRDWATKIMAEYSPVPFSEKAANQLSPSVFSLLDTPILKQAMEARPSCPTVDIKMLPGMLAKDVQQLYELCLRNATDLAWLKVFIGLADNPLPSSSPMLHEAEIPYERSKR